jgi:hypothetical protein
MCQRCPGRTLHASPGVPGVRSFRVGELFHFRLGSGGGLFLGNDVPGLLVTFMPVLDCGFVVVRQGLLEVLVADLFAGDDCWFLVGAEFLFRWTV